MDISLGDRMGSHGGDMPSTPQLMAEEDQEGRWKVIQYVQKLLGDTDNDLNPDEIASLAQDRRIGENL